MKYIFHNNYTLASMHGELNSNYKALVYEPKLELAQLYAKHLRLQNLEAYICNHHRGLVELALTISPEVLIYNLDQGLEPLIRVKERFPAIVVITIGNDAADKDLDELMEIGISGHINRKVTQPMDVSILAKQLLNY